MQSPPARWQILLAFAAIYLIWGSTYLAIRVGVAEAPPLLFAGTRFVLAGLILLGWTLTQKAPLPAAREWRGVLLISFLIFVCDYGLLFWAEQRVASGIAAVMMATIPMFIGLLEIMVLGTQRLTLRLALGFLIGFGGVALVVSRSLWSLETAHAPAGEWRGYAALLVASLSWSIATILTRKVALPGSKTMSAAVQMATGGAMLLIVAAASGEFGRFEWQSMTWMGWAAWGYLIAFGSLAGFTAYVWLIHHESPTKVGTYAYVNPVVAVILGTTLGDELIGARVIGGMLLVLVSVALITTTRTAKRGATEAALGEGGQEPQAAEP